MKLLKRTQIMQRTQDWYNKRNNILTASNVASVLEQSPFKTKVELLKEKLSKQEISSGSKATEWGVKYEPIANLIYKQMMNTDVIEVGLFTHPTYEWLGASPDGICSNGKLVEYKCLYSKHIIDKEPKYYWIQCQIQMEVCDLEMCDLFQCNIREYSYEEFINDTTPYKGKNKDGIYWRLEEFSLSTIYRDRDWFNNVLPILNDFWKDVQRYRRKRNRTWSFEDPTVKKTYLIDWSKWVAATEIRNYMINDPILDWLHKFGHRLNRDELISKDLNYNTYLLEEGIKFEKEIISKLEYVQVATTSECFSISKAELTKSLIKEHVPIIYQGVLHNTKNKTYGICDLIIRTDVLKKLIKKSFPIPTTEYVVVDIKNRILTQCKDDLLQNDVKEHKGQVIIYNDALGEILGETPQYCYILGRAYRKGKVISNEPFDNIGIIDITKEIDIIDKTYKAIEWIKELKKNGNKWVLDPPSHPNLFPNMCNNDDYPFHSIKKDLAHKLEEITLMWNISYLDRQNYHSNGIYRLSDIKELPITRNIELQDKMLKLWKTNEPFQSNLKLPRYPIEYYVDFETAFDGLIFLIGLGIVENNKWSYHSFISRNKEEEADNALKFYNLLKPGAPVYHWSPAEPSIFKYDYKINWIDLMSEFKKTHTIINGVFGFGLKGIAKKLYYYGLIKSKWTDNMDGRTAMLLFKNKYDLTDVKNYNEIDCYVMWEILSLVNNK